MAANSVGQKDDNLAALTGHLPVVMTVGNWVDYSGWNSVEKTAEWSADLTVVNSVALKAHNLAGLMENLQVVLTVENWVDCSG